MSTAIDKGWLESAMKRSASTLHKLYHVAFGQFGPQAKALGLSVRQLIRKAGYSSNGKVLRRGTHGAFGFDLRPKKSAKTDRRGCNAPGNARDRRFARRHP